MKYFLRLFFTVTTAFLPFLLKSQVDSCRLRISLLTCSPGTELYSTFGHSALRITDSMVGTDIVYNYGTFEFYDPQFLMKFTRGQLLYYLDQQEFSGFMQDYRTENRSVREQVLNLDCREKKDLQQAVFVNLRSENRSYKYDFLFDNCTTRLRDLILKKHGSRYKTGQVLPRRKVSFRNHIHQYLDQNKQYWSKLGIDILLGKKMDRGMTNDEAMFLPDYLEKGIDSSASSTGRLVSEKKILFQRQQTENGEPLFTPALILWIFLLAIVLIGFLKSGFAATLMTGIDFLIFFLNGLLGCFLLFMWFGTDHNTTQNNFNLVWAFPLHLFFAFLVRTKSKPVLIYFQVAALIYILLLISWFILPQQLNNALIPWVMVSGLRSLVISRQKKQIK